MRRHILPVVGLLLVAAWLRAWQIDHAPPGLHHDEVINAEIVEQEIFAGRPAIFYTTGGREGLFHLTLAGSMRWIGYNPLGFRWAGLAWGMLGLAGIYALAARLLGRRTALIALAFAATSFWSIYEGRAATRSVSMIALGALAALAFFAAWRKATRTPSSKGVWGLFALAGAGLGLTLYTYIASRVIPLVFALVIVYLFVTQRRALLANWKNLAVYLGAAALVGAPLFIYLQLHPLADMRFQMLAQPLDELRRGNLGPVSSAALKTLGMFVWRGDPQWHYNVAGLPVFDPASALLFTAGIFVSLRRIRQLPYAFYLIWLIISLLPGMLSEPAPHYMRTAAAQVAAYTLLGTGGAAIVAGAVKIERRYSQPAWLALALIWLGASIYNGWNFFVVWPANDEVRFYHQANLSELARYLDAQPDTSPVVGCSPFLNEQEDWLRSSRQTMRFLSAWPIRWNDCRDSLVLPSAGAPSRLFILYLTPYEDNIQPAILQWLAGAQPASINQFADIALYPLDATSRLAQTLDQARQATAALGPEAGGSAAILPVDFGHSLDFMGYQVEKPALRAGKKLVLTTWWQATGQAPPFLKVFVHLLDAAGNIAAQADRQSVLADTLQPGDIFLQIHSLDLPAELPPGEYRLSIGLYSGQTGERLPIYHPQAGQADRLLLQTITIKPPD